jgi:hypothetical protein
MSIYRRITLVFMLVVPSIVAAVLLGAGSAGAIAPAGPAEIGPEAAASDHAVSAPAAPAAAPSGARAVSVPGPAAVDAATYAREKAAAAHGSAPAATAVGTPPAESAAAAPASSIGASFAGLNRPSAASNGFVFNPPDTIVGKSGTHVIEATNSAIRLFSTTGSVLSTLTLSAFMGKTVTDPPDDILFDPKVYFDQLGPNQRFYVVALEVNGKGNTSTADNVSRIRIAVSRSSDPTTLGSSGWCRYNIDGRQDVGTSNESWADFPMIGAGQDAFTFSVNNFRFDNGNFTHGFIHVWRKDIASNNASSCPTVPRRTFRSTTTVGDFGRFSIQPVQHYSTPSSFTGTTNPVYLVNGRRGSSDEYRIWRIRNVASGSPTISSVLLHNGNYVIPPSSPQPSGSIVIDTGDDRVLQGAGRANTFVAIQTTGCQFTGGSIESCAKQVRFSVGQNSSGGLTAAGLENLVTGFGDNIFVHHPSIARNSALQVGSVWEFSGSSNSLSSAAMIKAVGQSNNWTGVSTFASGSCSQPDSPGGDSTTARSGDYSGAQTDPSDSNSFWLAGERSTTISSSCQWDTRVVRLVP